MKLRSTTPASISWRTKWVSFVIVILFMVSGAIVYLQTRPVSADQYDDKIAMLQKDMARYQAEADRLNSEANSLANALAQLTNEKNALQAQINVNQAQHDKLVAQIASTETEIKQNQDALGETIADLYLGDNVSTIEVIASSENIGDFIDKQEYRTSVKEQLNATIKKVQNLKIQLTTQKEDVAKVLESQKAARDTLVAKESAQANLVAQTQNDESRYQGMIKDSEKQIADAKAAQAALRARTVKTGGYTLVDAGSLTAYPWNESNCSMWGYMSTEGADGNGGDGRGYGCRQCASYVAWRIARETGIYYRWGNGGNFGSAAVGAGYKNLGTNPEPGSIAVMWGNPGHVAWVEAVDGNKVLVSQYNYNYGAGWGMYSEMWLATSFFDQYVKIK